MTTIYNSLVILKWQEYSMILCGISTYISNTSKLNTHTHINTIQCIKISARFKVRQLEVTFSFCRVNLPGNVMHIYVVCLLTSTQHNWQGSMQQRKADFQSLQPLWVINVPMIIIPLAVKPCGKKRVSKHPELTADHAMSFIAGGRRSSL